MKTRYPFLYVVILSGLAAAAFLVFNLVRQKPGLAPASLTGDRVAVVDITGIITSSFDSEGRAVSSRSVIADIEKYADDSSVKALVLRIDSPGGTVVASQEIYDYLRRLGAEKKKKIVVSMADVAASGGYYIACAADSIIANPGTITGSIGVIMEFPNFEELMGKIGVKSTVIKSGKYKDTGHSGRPMTDDERALLQGLVDDIYGQFLSAVSESRKIPIEKLAELADGRIFSGQQAVQHGLVDKIGDLDSAIDEAAALAGIEGEPHVVRPKRKKRIWELLETRLSSFFPPSPLGFTGKARLLYLWR